MHCNTMSTPDATAATHALEILILYGFSDQMFAFKLVGLDYLSLTLDLNQYYFYRTILHAYSICI